MRVLMTSFFVSGEIIHVAILTWQFLENEFTTVKKKKVKKKTNKKNLFGRPDGVKFTYFIRFKHGRSTHY